METAPGQDHPVELKEESGNEVETGSEFESESEEEDDDIARFLRARRLP